MVWSVTISPDSKYIISGSEDCSIKIFDIENQKEIFHFEKVHTGEMIQLLIFIFSVDTVCTVAISQDMKYLVSGSRDKSIKIFDFTQRKELFHFQNAHEGNLGGL